MTAPEDEDKDSVAATGDWGVVEWAVDRRGVSNAREFFESLSQKDQAKVLALFKRLALFGVIKDAEKFKRLGSVGGRELHEFKSFQIRMFGEFRGRGRFVVGYGVIKKKDKLRPQDLDTAARLLSESVQ